MKTAFDAKRALNNSTGLGNHARILLNALLRDYPDNDYLLFSPRAKDEYFHLLQGHFKLFFPETKFYQSFNSLWRSYGIRRQLAANRINLYHGLSNEIPFGIKDLGIPAVVTIHDLIFLKHTEQYPFIDRQFYTLKTKYAAQHADRIIATSNETKNDLIERYKVPEKKILVVYPSVDSNFQTSLPISPEVVRKKYTLPEKYLLNVGSFFPRKNQRKIVEAFALIANQIEEDLVLVGGIGTIKESVEQGIAAKGLKGRVKILAGITNEDLPAVYHNASAFIFPSLYEGFGAPVLEALFSRVPVIASQGGAIEEAAGPGSIFINPHSAEDIAEKILMVLKDEALKKMMVDKGYQHALTMSDARFAQKVMDVYKSLV